MVSFLYFIHSWALYKMPCIDWGRVILSCDAPLILIMTCVIVRLRTLVSSFEIPVALVLPNSRVFADYLRNFGVQTRQRKCKLEYTRHYEWKVIRAHLIPFFMSGRGVAKRTQAQFRKSLQSLWHQVEMTECNYSQNDEKVNSLRRTYNQESFYQITADAKDEIMILNRIQAKGYIYNTVLVAIVCS